MWFRGPFFVWAGETGEGAMDGWRIKKEGADGGRGEGESRREGVGGNSRYERHERKERVIVLLGDDSVLDC